MPLLVTLMAATVRADDLLYRFEGDVPPLGLEAGWQEFNACDPPWCAESLNDGHLIFQWENIGNLGGDFLNYTYRITTVDEPAPPSLWVEWRFRSNVPLHSGNPNCDAAFVVGYERVFDLVYMYGNSIISFSGDKAIQGLSISDFHTLRFESLDGQGYTIWVNGAVFIRTVDQHARTSTKLQMYGLGGCSPAVRPAINEWDYVRYGTTGFGEKIVANDPPSGFVDLRHQAPMDRFAVNFDQPNYVYIENITVEVTGIGTKPVVTKTLRRDQDGPESLEIVLDRPIPPNATTRFIMNDGEITNVVRYTTKLGDVDGDNDTDLIEIAALQNCFYKPVPDPLCGALNFFDDPYIDHADTPELISPYTLTGPAD